jgi:hypothetical protein
LIIDGVGWLMFYRRRVWGRKPTQEEVEGKVKSEGTVKDPEI